MACYVRLMRRKDVAQVTEIDREAFPTLWPPVNYERELRIYDRDGELEKVLSGAEEA